MKNLSRILIATMLTCTITAAAQGRKSYSSAVTSQQELKNALGLLRSGQHSVAANEIFGLLKKPDLADEKMQMHYILGLTLMELKLYQVAAFQFVDVLRASNSKYTKLSIDKLIVAADQLGDETLLNYAVARMNVDELPSENRDMLYFRMGEVLLKTKKFAQAADLFSRVPFKSRYYIQAKYNQGLAYLEGNQPDLAIRVFKDLYQSRSTMPVTDTLRVSAQMALARSYYQKKDFDSSIATYRAVPRDHEMWHEALFESSWALFMGAKLRSTLSNFQSLHSSYYENFYLPESLLLRAIVYLYICKYDELEKVLNLYERSYGTLSDRLGDFMKQAGSPMDYYSELEKAQMIRSNGGPEKVGYQGLRIPYSAARYILQQGEFEASTQYLKKLYAEKKKLESMGGGFPSSGIGIYSAKLLTNRIQNTKSAIGDVVKDQMQLMRLELRDFYEQASFIRYELINARKETLQKKIEGKLRTDARVDDKYDRQFYIQNGYEYYPFRGEFWLDEIGNYHYLGKSSCN